MARGSAVRLQQQQQTSSSVTSRSTSVTAPFERSYRAGSGGFAAGNNNNYNTEEDQDDNQQGYANTGYNGGGYSGGGYSHGGAGGGYNWALGGSNSKPSNNNNAGGAGGSNWLSSNYGSPGGGNYYTPASPDVNSIFKDYSAAISALTLLGFLYFLNILQNQLLSAGSQTVVFTVGGATGNGTGRRRRDTFEDEDVWGREYDTAPPGQDFEHHLSDKFWVPEEESEFDKGEDSGAGQNLHTSSKHDMPRGRNRGPSSSAETRGGGSNILSGSPGGGDTFSEGGGRSGVPGGGEEHMDTPSPPVTKPTEIKPDVRDTPEWRLLADLLPERLDSSLVKCRDLVACTLMPPGSWHESPCAHVLRAHGSARHPDLCTELVDTLTKMLGHIAKTDD